MERPPNGAEPILVKMEYELYQFVGNGTLLALVAGSMARH